MTLRDLAALAIFALTFGAAVVFVRRTTARTFGVVLPIGMGVLIAWESVLFNVLSLFRLLLPVTVALVNVLLALCVILLLNRKLRALGDSGTMWRDELFALGRALRPTGVQWTLVPLLVLLCITAVVYPPTNWDSMTYHMARVAYWIQNRSVAYYPTGIQRQNQMGPGAEYLILFLQIVSGSDRWANLVQFICYVIAIVATGSLSRLAGLSRSLSPWAQIFVAALPMAILEATSTQNDLVATSMTLAILAAAIPFLRRARPWQTRDLALLTGIVCSGFLVKPTSILAAVPFLLSGIVIVALSLLRKKRKLADVRRAVLLSAVVGLIVVGPDVYRKYQATRSPLGSAPELLTSADGWKVRMVNSITSSCQHALFPEKMELLIQRTASSLLHYKPTLFCHNVFRFNEDRVGNPLQALMTVVLLGGVLALGWRNHRKRTLIAISPLFAWLVFHWYVRNQEWLSRLHTPLFFITPLVWTAYVKGRGSRFASYTLSFISILSIAYGYVCASNNVFRPLSIPGLLAMDRDVQYYAAQPWTLEAHNNVLTRLKQTGCRRLGLFLTGDSYDYPLTWRAMRSGTLVRHYRTTSGWPCLIYSDNGTPPGAWADAGGGVWRRREE